MGLDTPRFFEDKLVIVGESGTALSCMTRVVGVLACRENPLKLSFLWGGKGRPTGVFALIKIA